MNQMTLADTTTGGVRIIITRLADTAGGGYTLTIDEGFPVPTMTYRGDTLDALVDHVATGTSSITMDSVHVAAVEARRFERTATTI